MKVFTDDYNRVDDELKSNQVDLVNYKLVVLFNAKKSINKEELKSLIRSLLKNVGLPMRFKIDISEDSWVDKENVEGKFLCVIRTKDDILIDKLKPVITSKIVQLNLQDVLEFIEIEKFNVSDFRNIGDLFDRAIYEVVLDVKKDPVSTLIESSGRWSNKVRQWDGEVVEEVIRGMVRIKAEKADSDSDIYNLIVDVPLGLDVYRVLEQEFKLKKGSLKGYPVKGILFYESIDSKKNYLSRPKCNVTGEPIERTLGGYVGEKSVYCLFN